jgi:imidazole glycerol phosphate synthase subunit HisF
MSEGKDGDWVETFTQGKAGECCWWCACVDVTDQTDPRVRDNWRIQHYKTASEINMKECKWCKNTERSGIGQNILLWLDQETCWPLDVMYCQGDHVTLFCLNW